MQPLLPFDCSQRRTRTPESDRLYNAILQLRMSGHQVYRAGKHHKIDGNLRTGPEVIAIARSKRTALWSRQA